MNRDTFTFTLSPLRPSEVLSLFGIENIHFHDLRKIALEMKQCFANIEIPEDGWIEPVETCRQALCEYIV